MLDKSLLIICIATAFYIQYAIAIECYVCNSHENALCKTDPRQNESFKVQCPAPNNICRKIYQRIEFSESGQGPDERVVRQCGQNETGDRFDKQCFKIFGLGIDEEMCFCTQDLCNASTNPHLLSGIQWRLIASLLIGALWLF